MVRILIVDDHKIFRLGLRTLLERETDLKVVAEAANGREALQQAKQFQPDLIIMDVAMPEMNGVEATYHLRSSHPGVKIIALSMHSDRRYVLNMIEAGAVGYLIKECAGEELAHAIRHIVAGETYFSPELLDIFKQGGQQGCNLRNSAFSLLTALERQVVKLISDGQDSAQIAARLNIRDKHVETLRRGIMAKLKICSIAELTKFAIREGLTFL